MRRSSGFTLIELMIVVAIIGLLASIAIPNFLAFQCKSKQSEPRAQLGSIFSVQKVFLSEHNTYATDLVALGWAPDGAPLYLYGFAASVQYPATVAGIPTFDPSLNNTQVAGVIGSPARWDTSRTLNLEGDPFDSSADLPATACAGQTFIMGAVGDVHPDKTLIGLDKWSIDHHRYLASPENDCLSVL